MASPGVRLAPEPVDVMTQGLAAGFVVVNDADLAVMELHAPYSGAVAHAQVPRRMYGQRRLPRQILDTPLFAQIGQFAGVECTPYTRLEAALVFLRILVGRHLLARVL